MGGHDPDDPGLPIKLGPCSNGEFVPPAPTPLVREAVRRARAESEVVARRLGLTRRRFLHTLSGAAVTLVALNACSDEQRRADPTSTTGAGGRYTLPPESTTDPAAATTVLAGEEPVLDVQGHLLEGEAALAFGSGFPQAGCDADEPADCFSAERFLDEIFLRSDTSLIILSAIPAAPGPDNPLSIEVMERTRRLALELCEDERVLIQGQVNPNLGRLDEQLDGMEALAAEHPIVAWKTYTHTPGPAWRLDDDRGDAMLDKAVALGKPIVCVHKGISGDAPAASPADIGPAAARHPDVRLCVYHSGYEHGVVEGPYDPAAPNGGVDRLLASLESAGLRPGSNVYAELGSTWRAVMGKPDEAAHLLGKLLLHVGEDNVLWGTDSIWYGSPQDQIQAFRAFEITAELQERFGYPALTAQRKAKILGANAARLHGIEPSTVACPLTREQLQASRESAAAPFRTYGPQTRPEVARLIATHGGIL